MKKQLFYIKEVRNWNIGIKEKGEKIRKKEEKKKRKIGMKEIYGGLGWKFFGILGDDGKRKLIGFGRF